MSSPLPPMDDSISLDALDDFDFEDPAELADLLENGRRRPKRITGADARAMLEAEYNGFDSDF